MKRSYDVDSTWALLGKLPTESIALVVMGCLVGTGIGYTGWWCRGKISATSFTLVGVLNKCMTVLVNLLIWDQHASPMGILSLFLCLIGGAFYKQAPMRKDKVGEDSPFEQPEQSNTTDVEMNNSNTNDLTKRNNQVNEEDMTKPLMKTED